MEGISVDSCLLKFKVTCLKCIGNFIYAGVGGNLLIFESSERYYKLYKQIENVLPNNIHGILPDNEHKNIAIYGNKKLTVIPCFPSEWKKTPIWEASQWIQCVQWLSNESLAVVTGLNEVDLLNWTTKNVEKTAVCEEKCIIYSAHLIGCDWDNLVVLAGTVYREILVWAPSKAEQSSTSVIHRLKGHNGVIFSVTYDHASRRICSTSDDRTVRIWNVVNAEQCDRLSLEQWVDSVIEATATIYGHTARVWRAALLDDGRIVSIGEDSLLCVWDKMGKNQLRQETHQGGRLCCLDIDKQHGLAITGGADGGISVWSLDSGLNEIARTDLPLQEPARLVVLASGATVVVHRSGCLIESQNSCIVFKDSRFVNYCLSEVSLCGKYVALASIQGDLLVLEDTIQSIGTLSLLTEKNIFAGKIFSVQWLKCGYILCCGSEGRMILYKLNKTGDVFNLELKNHFTLPACRERWFTCATLLGPTLICGTRNGSIHVYRLDQTDIEDPVQSLHKIHGRLGVTSLFIGCDNSLWTSGRDCTVRKFLVDLMKHRIDQVLVDRLPFSWVAEVIQPEREDVGILVVGFHEKDVVIWSLKSRVVIWRLDCCGGHREWKCFVKSNLLHFYFIKDKTVHSIKKPLESIVSPPVLDGFHTREINTLKMVAMLDSWSLLVSGGEDNTVRISFLNSGRSLICDVVLNGHLSSVRTLAVVPLKQKCNAYKCLVFTAGGRAQMKVWSLDFYIDCDKPIVRESIELASHMINDELQLRKISKNFLPRLDPETRYMDIAVYENFNNSTHYTVFSACSDGYLRVFDFSLLDKQLTLVTAISHQRCLLKIGQIEISDCIKSENKVLALTTTTDGLICVWDTKSNKQIFNHPVFESGINSCDTFKMTDERYLIASGGDNCKVTIDLVDLEQVLIVGLWTSCELHFSQVSGVKLEKNLLFTVGIDQRFNVLKWTLLENNRLEVVHLQKYCSYVPDVHGLSVIRREDVYEVCIYGVGVEVLKVSPIKMR